MGNAHQSRRRVLAFETMESLALMSGLTPFVGTPAVHPLVQNHATPSPIVVNIQGSVSGTYTATPRPHGAEVSLAASGFLGSLGAGTLTAKFHATGNNAGGQVTESVDLTLSNGTLQLSLTGPALTGAGTSVFSYTITGGTGSFHNKAGDAQGSGTVAVTVGAAAGGSGSVTLVFNPPTAPPPGGPIIFA